MYYQQVNQDAGIFEAQPTMVSLKRESNSKEMKPVLRVFDKWDYYKGEDRPSAFVMLEGSSCMMLENESKSLLLKSANEVCCLLLLIPLHYCPCAWQHEPQPPHAGYYGP